MEMGMLGLLEMSGQRACLFLHAAESVFWDNQQLFLRECLPCPIECYHLAQY